MLNRITRDGAATSPGGVRRFKYDGAQTLSLFRAYTLDATVEDAILTLPPCVPNAGRLFFAARVDAVGTLHDAFVEVEDPSNESIQGATSIQLTSQYDNLLLLATAAGVFLIVSREP